MTLCYLCPHRCGVDRPATFASPGTMGACQMPVAPVVARAGLHHWEEPVISGTRGSGTVFFSGCNLHCVFCQNYNISSENQGKEITVQRLREIYLELINQGAHNINLVTPTHFNTAICQSLTEPLPVPVVYNTGSYETLDSLKNLQGKVQIYLPDLKYYADKAALKYSNAYNYFATSTAAIREMYRQVGNYKINKDGLLIKGVIIRHLVMPGLVEDSKKIIDWVASTFKPGQVMFSLMHQYVPCGAAGHYPEINRKLSQDEYAEIEAYLFATDIEDGFVQEEEAADKQFIPTFDGTGI